ncbi:MAG: pyridoxal phosphate-dependent aminotransferase family protein [Rickettsiales bacterium]|nr:pyridoxal phosphate-dependent aminotransferase family protein [Rickettsiales bacterium]
MFNLDSYAIAQLKYKENQKLQRVITSYQAEGKFKVDQDGNKLIDFTSNDYFAMAQNREILAKASSEVMSMGSSSSRLISGSSPIYDRFEQVIAQHHKMEKSVIFGSGYLAAIGFYPAFYNAKDLIISDKNIHASHIDGIKLSGAKFMRFKHNDLGHLQDLLEKNRDQYQKCIIVSETLFSMHGDFAPVSELSRLAKKYKSDVLMDDAHGFLLDDELGKIDRDNLIILGTLSKAVAGYGGYITASKYICDYLVSSARSLIYSTAIPEFILNCNYYSFRELIENNVKYQNALYERIDYLAKLLGRSKTYSPIFIIAYDSIDEMDAQYQKLYDSEFLVSRIRPPTAETPRLRISISTGHDNNSLRQIANIIVSNNHSLHSA